MGHGHGCDGAVALDDVERAVILGPDRSTYELRGSVALDDEQRRIDRERAFANAVPLTGRALPHCGP